MSGGGKTTLTTVAGDTLTVTKMDGEQPRHHRRGGQQPRTVRIFDVNQSNGVIHVIDDGADAEDVSCPRLRIEGAASGRPFFAPRLHYRPE